MSGEIPDGLSIVSVWAVEGAYASDAAERRPACRAEHLARIGRLMDEGTILAAGAFADMSGSLLIVRASSEAEAMALAQQDVYVRAGVWASVRVRAFGLVMREG